MFGEFPHDEKYDCESATAFPRLVESLRVIIPTLGLHLNETTRLVRPRVLELRESEVIGFPLESCQMTCFGSCADCCNVDVYAKNPPTTAIATANTKRTATETVPLAKI